MPAGKAVLGDRFHVIEHDMNIHRIAVDRTLV